MDLQPDAAGGANGLYKLPDAILTGCFIVLWNWIRIFWQAGTSPDLLCSGSYLAASNYLEPYLVTVFPIWSAGMGLAQPDLLEKTTDAESKYERRYVNIKGKAIFWDRSK